MDIEQLKHVNAERLERIAAEAARLSLSSEEQLAEMQEREANLASRYGDALSTMNAVRSVLRYDSDEYQCRVELGADEKGYKYFAWVFPGQHAMIEFRAEDPSNKASDYLGTTYFAKQFSLERGSSVLQFAGTKANWSRTSGLPVDSHTKNELLNRAKAQIVDYEGTAAMLWGAITDPSLNPQLAERAAVSRQA